MSVRYPWRPSVTSLPVTFYQAMEQGSGYSSDINTFQDGDVFVALKRRSHDSHEMVPHVLGRSPTAIIVSDPTFLGDPRVILVEDTAVAHWVLACHFRKKFSGQVIAVGGSVGKTSTKDFLYQLLSKKFRCIATQLSQNCHVGVPRTLERLRADVDVAIIEIGIDGPDQMLPLAGLVQPDCAVLTPLAEEHLRQLGSIDQVIEEEIKLFDVTGARRGRLYAHAGETWLQGSRLELADRVIAIPSPDSDFCLRTAQLPPVMQSNAHLAMRVALDLGVSHTELLEGLGQLGAPLGRGHTLEASGDRFVICDYYNASPLSMRAALTHAAEIARQKGVSLHLTLGDMLDLGEESFRLHLELLPLLIASKPSSVLLLGVFMPRVVPDFLSHMTSRLDVSFADRLADVDSVRLQRHFASSGVHLIKGSRGMALELALSYVD